MSVELDAGYRFAMIPEALVYSDISGTAIKVFAALHRHGTDAKHCYPSHARLADLCHLSVPTVKRALAELVESGWVSIVHRRHRDGRQTSNGYHLHDHVESGQVTSDPQVIDELPPQVIDELPPRSPVSYEREQCNESQKNETPPTPRARPKRARTKPAGGRRDALRAEAMSNGWTDDEWDKMISDLHRDRTVRSVNAVIQSKIRNDDKPLVSVMWEPDVV